MDFNTVFADDRDMDEAVRWAYLRWFADYCAVVPGRLAGPFRSTKLPGVATKGHDLDTVLAQIRWDVSTVSPAESSRPSRQRCARALRPVLGAVVGAVLELEVPLVFHGGCHGNLDTMTLMAADASTRAGRVSNRASVEAQFWHLMVAGLRPVSEPEVCPRRAAYHVDAREARRADHVASTTSPNAVVRDPEGAKLTPSEHRMRRICSVDRSSGPKRSSHARLDTSGSVPRRGAWTTRTSKGISGLQQRAAFTPAVSPRPTPWRRAGGAAADDSGFDLPALQKVADTGGPTVPRLDAAVRCREPSLHIQWSYHLEARGRHE